MRNINKRFGKRMLFADLSLKINSGEMVAILGNSGSGKSTLLNIVGLLEPFERGGVFLGKDSFQTINGQKAVMARRNVIGYLFQNFALIDNLSVAEKLQMALKFSKASDNNMAIKKVLEEVGLPPSVALQKVYELSGGQQQRVAVARLSLKPCEIILSDEPTGSLDAENKHKVMSLLQKIHQAGKTVIIVTHDLEIAALCDRSVQLASLGEMGQLA